MFGSWKVLGKEKNTKENYFFMFDFTIKKYKRKSNLIKFSYKFLDFKIT